MADRVEPGLGQDIRTYSDQQVVDRVVERAISGQDIEQLSKELAQRALPS